MERNTLERFALSSLILQSNIVMQYLKYIVIICAAAVLRLLSKDDNFLSTPYIIKSVGILLFIAIGIVMIVRDVKQRKSNSE